MKIALSAALATFTFGVLAASSAQALTLGPKPHVESSVTQAFFWRDEEKPEKKHKKHRHHHHGHSHKHKSDKDKH